MKKDFAEQIAKSANYQTLVHKRSRLAWTLTALMLLTYFAFLFLVAFKKESLAQPISDGVTTYAIPVGIGLIVFTILITGFYVRRANAEFDSLTKKIHEEHKVGGRA